MPSSTSKAKQLGQLKTYTLVPTKLNLAVATERQNSLVV